MSEQLQLNRPTSNRPKPRLYRTVLSIAVAALVAVWLPFSILYIDALTKHAAAVSAVSTAHQTTVAGGAAPVPVTTRTS